MDDRQHERDLRRQSIVRCAALAGRRWARLFVRRLRSGARSHALPQRSMARTGTDGREPALGGRRQPDYELARLLDGRHERCRMVAFPSFGVLLAWRHIMEARKFAIGDQVRVRLDSHNTDNPTDVYT